MTKFKRWKKIILVVLQNTDSSSFKRVGEILKKILSIEKDPSLVNLA